MKTLSHQAFATAQAYLAWHGRPLDQARWSYCFADGPPADVLTALSIFQNADGGFGHGLEPDIRTPASSVIATSVAFQILREIGATAGEPVVQRAVDYLLQNYDAERRVWPIVPPAVEDAPHAPWWTYANTESNFHDFRLNPRAEILGHLYHYQELVPETLLREVDEAVLAHLPTVLDSLEMHDLLCVIRLAETVELPSPQRLQVQQMLKAIIRKHVETDPEQWTGYGLPPLAVISAPNSFLAEVIAPDALAANLDFLIEQQLQNGAWPIPWNWAFVDAAAWAQAEHDWQGYQIVNNLKLLQAFGRIEAVDSEAE